MRSPPYAEHEEVNSSLSYVFEDSIVCRADSNIRSRITERSCLLRHHLFKSVVKKGLKIVYSIRMLNGSVLNHIEHVDLGPKYFRECDRITCRVGGRRSKVGRKKNPRKWKSP